MTKQLTASVTKEGDWYVAQCLEFDIASQGKTEAEALSNLAEALELFFEEPRPTLSPSIATVSIEVDAA